MITEKRLHYRGLWRRRAGTVTQVCDKTTVEHGTWNTTRVTHAFPPTYRVLTPDPLVVLSPAATGGKSRDVDDAVTDVTDDSTDSQSMCDARAGGPCRGAAATGWRVSLGSGSTRPPRAEGGTVTISHANNNYKKISYIYILASKE